MIITVRFLSYAFYFLPMKKNPTLRFAHLCLFFITFFSLLYSINASHDVRLLVTIVPVIPGVQYSCANTVNSNNSLVLHPHTVHSVSSSLWLLWQKVANCPSKENVAERQQVEKLIFYLLLFQNV